MKQQYSLRYKNLKNVFFDFSKNAMWLLNKMETQIILNLLSDSSIKQSKFDAKKFYVIDNQTGGKK